MLTLGGSGAALINLSKHNWRYFSGGQFETAGNAAHSTPPSLQSSNQESITLHARPDKSKSPVTVDFTHLRACPANVRSLSGAGALQRFSLTPPHFGGITVAMIIVWLSQALLDSTGLLLPVCCLPAACATISKYGNESKSNKS